MPPKDQRRFPPRFPHSSSLDQLVAPGETQEDPYCLPWDYDLTLWKKGCNTGKLKKFMNIQGITNIRKWSSQQNEHSPLLRAAYLSHDTMVNDSSYPVIPLLSETISVWTGSRCLKEWLHAGLDVGISRCTTVPLQLSFVPSGSAGVSSCTKCEWPAEPKNRIEITNDYKQSLTGKNAWVLFTKLSQFILCVTFFRPLPLILA